MSDITVVTVDEVLAYLGYDYADDMVKSNVSRAIKAADAYLKGSLGENYPPGDPRCKELALIIAADLYENRGVTTSGTMTNNVRRLVDDMSLQIRLELRRGLYG